MITRTRLIAFSGITTLLCQGAVLAAPPVSFDGWTASSGALDTSLSCGGAGVSCTTMVEDDGFIQEEITVDDYTYIRLIVTDPNADGAAGEQVFSSESFIPFAFNDEGISQGLATKQVIRDVAEGFVDQAEIQRSMMRFRDPGMRFPTDIQQATPPEEMWSVRLTQSFDRDDLNSTFQYTNWTEMVSSFPAATPDTNDVIGYTLSLSQEVPLNPDGATAGIDANARQGFEHRQAGGSAGNLPQEPFFPSLYFASAPITPAGEMTLGGDTVSWEEMQTVSTSWLVQTDLFNADNVAIQSQGVTNLTTGDSASQLSTSSSPAPVSPFDWDVPTFGAAPTLP